MAQTVPVSLILKNQAELSAALRRLSVATGKLPAQVINRAMMSMALRARNKMPVVSDATIRSELQEYKVPVQSYSRKGKLLGKGKARSKSFFGDGESVPFLALLVNARVRGSKAGFNSRTNNRFLLEESPFKGRTRQAGQAKMLETMRAMFNARIKSRGFFKLCAYAVYHLFARATGKPESVGSGSVTRRIDKVAGGTPATGTGKAAARFWISSTRADPDGLFRVAEPVWQEALNHEAGFVGRKAAEAEYKQAARQVGFKVT